MRHPKLERFADQMQIELCNNAPKGSVFDWKGVTNKIADLEYHKAKMMLSIRTNDRQALKEYLADCAVILMSIGDEVGLYDEESVSTEFCSEVLPVVFKQVKLEDCKKETTFVQIKTEEDE